MTLYSAKSSEANNNNFIKLSRDIALHPNATVSGIDMKFHGCIPIRYWGCLSTHATSSSQLCFSIHRSGFIHWLPILESPSRIIVDPQPDEYYLIFRDSKRDVEETVAIRNNKFLKSDLKPLEIMCTENDSCRFANAPRFTGNLSDLKLGSKILVGIACGDQPIDVQIELVRHLAFFANLSMHL